MKTLFTFAVLTTLVSSLAFSQSGGSAAAEATFTVGTPLTLMPAALPGDFGDLVPGTTYTVAADGAISPPDAGGATVVTPVGWDIMGQRGANVEITFALPQYFVSLTGSHVPYDVTPRSAGWAGMPFTTGLPYNPIDPRVPNTVTLVDSVGSASVQLGGVLALPLGADGLYTAQFILTAAYTGL